MKPDILDIKEDPQLSEEILQRQKQKKRRIYFLIAIVVSILAIVGIIVGLVVGLHARHNESSNDTTNDAESNKNEKTNPQSVTLYTTVSQVDLHPPGYAHAVSPYANLTRLKVLQPASTARHIYIMGDIHGCLSEMNQLLDKIQFDPKQDIMILTGDLVYRGEDSIGVIHRAKEIGAYCVRGNHDDKVIRMKGYELKHGIDAMAIPEDVMPEENVIDPIKFGNKHAPIAKEMNVDEYNYLAGCPLIIDIPDFKARVVHGGVDPFVANVINNDPWSVLNMRDMNSTSNEPSKLKLSIVDSSVENWTQVYQRHNPDNITVYYGHDASRGLSIQSSTVGLDSGCVHGRQLSVMDLKSRQLTQVGCRLRGGGGTNKSTDDLE